MQQNKQDMMQQFNQFYRDFMASGKNPMEELQKKISSGQVSQGTLQQVINTAKQIAPLFGK